MLKGKKVICVLLLAVMLTSILPENVFAASGYTPVETVYITRTVYVEVGDIVNTSLNVRVSGGFTNFAYGNYFAYRGAECVNLTPQSTGSCIIYARKAGVAVIRVGFSYNRPGGFSGTSSRVEAEQLQLIICPKSHYYDAGVVTAEPTCTTEGARTYTCSTCKKTKTEAIPKTEHNYVTTYIPPTCTEEGQILFTCTACQDSYTTKLSDATGHRHTELINVREATCKEKGYTGDLYCRDCETVIESGTETEMLPDHSWDEGSITKEATCTEAGVKTYTCEECGAKRTEELSATGHTGGTELRGAVEATCEQDGYTGDTYCRTCGELLEKGNEILSSGHSWDEGSITKEATCIETGMKTYTCEECGAKRTEELSATGHTGGTELRGAVEATCEQDGYTGDTYCRTCGELLEKGNEILSSGHSWDEGSITKEATCTETGVKTYTCKECGAKRTEELSATGHTGGTELRGAVEATSERDGYTGDTYCRTCGGLLEKGSVIQAFGHPKDEENGTIVETPPASEPDTQPKPDAEPKPDTQPKPDAESKPDTVSKPAPGTSVNDMASGGLFKVAEDEKTVQYVKPLNSKKKTLVIPDSISIDGSKYNVVSIASNALKNNKSVQTVTIGKNVTSIGNNSFSGCKKLTTVSGGKAVKTIGSGAFNGCVKLKKITLGTKVTSIGTKAFYKCTGLTKISIPSKVKKIGKQAFYGCKNLKSITINTKLLKSKNVGSNAFKGVYSKVSVKVPKNMQNTYKKMLRSKGIGTKASYKQK